MTAESGSSPGPVVRFRVLGTVELDASAAPALDSVAARPKLLALLVFLAAASPRGFQRRDTLVTLFWPEMDQERARSALRQSLYYLRQFLGEHLFVARGDDEVGLAADLAWCDVTAFEEALSRGQHETALSLYRGDLLTGFHLSGAPEFERWLDERRAGLKRRAREAAWHLADRGEREGNAAAVGRWTRFAVQLDPFDETLVRDAIRLLDRQGDRPGALLEYESFARRLRDEMDLEPSPETRSLAGAIRARTTEAEGPQREAVEPRIAPDHVALTGAPRRDMATRPRPLRGWRERGWIVPAAAVVVVLAGVWISGYRLGGGSMTDSRRVLVGVFDNLTGDPALDPLGRLAADWIADGLGQLEFVEIVPAAAGLVPGLDVRTASDVGSGDIRALARAVGAGTVVTGAYHRRGDSISFQAQIVEMRGGRLLSTPAPAVAPRGAPEAVMDVLRGTVVAAAASVLDSRIGPPGASRPATSLEAYQAFLEGYRAYQQVPRRAQEALRFLYRAVDLDSTYLEPRFFIVWSHLSLTEYAAADSQARLIARRRPQLTALERHMLDWQLAEISGDRRGALEATRALGQPLNIGHAALRANHLHEAAEALRRAEGLTEAHYQWIGLTEAYHMLGDYRRELREARRARELNPDRVDMLTAELRAQAALGQVSEVRRGLDELWLLPPEPERLVGGLLPGYRFSPAPQVWTLVETGAELRAHDQRAAADATLEAAINWYQSRPEVERDLPSHRWGVGEALYLRERWDEARAVYERLASDSPGDINAWGFLGVLAARRGDRVTALAISERLTGTAPQGDFGRDLYWQACIAAQLGEKERAMGLLQEAFARGRVFTILLHRDVDLEPLRDYPPFRRFLSSRD